MAFLITVGKQAAIRKQLDTAGYTDADTERGFALVRDAITPPTKVTIADNPVIDALAQLEAWRTTGFVIACSTLTHLHPEQESFLLNGLDFGIAAVFVPNLSLFLTRCSELETSKERKPTHKEDQAALATLEVRGFTKAERKRLRALVTVIETHAAPLEATIGTDESAARFHALRGWILDWRNVAKVVITRRDWLLALGIGRRRAKKEVTTPAPQPAPVVPAPVVVAPPVLSAHLDEDSGPQSRAA